MYGHEDKGHRAILWTSQRQVLTVSGAWPIVWICAQKSNAAGMKVSSWWLRSALSCNHFRPWSVSKKAQYLLENKDTDVEVCGHPVYSLLDTSCRMQVSENLDRHPLSLRCSSRWQHRSFGESGPPLLTPLYSRIAAIAVCPPMECPAAERGRQGTDCYPSHTGLLSRRQCCTSSELAPTTVTDHYNFATATCPSLSSHNVAGQLVNDWRVLNF